MHSQLSIEVQGVSKKYAKTEVLSDIAMMFQAGQFISLMGKNGSGKSTLMRLLAKEELVTAGTIRFNDQLLSDPTLDVNSKMVFISEDHDLPFHVPLIWWIQKYQVMYPDYDQKVSDRLLKSFEVSRDKPYSSLSRGQKMKALFALQAPKKPFCYFLDEITAVLDAGSRWTLMQFLKEETARGALVLMSTNIASEMNGFATDICFLENGRQIFSGECRKLTEAFRKVRVRTTDSDSIHRQIEKVGGKRIHLNTDQTWTVLIESSKYADLDKLELLNDNREITVSDIQYYFTGGEGPM